MSRPDLSFAERLASARAMVARGLPPMPAHIADQYGAARDEARGLHDQIGALLPRFQPGREWFYRAHAAVPDEVRAYLLAAVLGCMGDVCGHLRRRGPQPALVMLPLRRIACLRCAATVRCLVTAPDECDLCEWRGVVTFVPFACHYGPALITGDACPSCADVLGIRSEVAS